LLARDKYALKRGHILHLGAACVVAFNSQIPPFAMALEECQCPLPGSRAHDGEG